MGQKEVKDAIHPIMRSDKSDHRSRVPSAIKRLISVTAACSVMMSVTSCVPAGRINGSDLMEGYAAAGLTPSAPSPSSETVDFAIRMLSATADADGGASVVISPYSILTALALTANGASGQTLSEIESAIGLTLPELNAFLPSYTASLPCTDKAKLTTANSIWMRDGEGRLHVEESFLQKNADLYHADAYSVPFDESTRCDINGWVRDRTDGKIKDMLVEIPDSAVLYLINAVLFDAEWQSVYKKNEIREETFTNAEGEAERVDFMYDGEGRGFSLDGAVGLVRPYAGRGYDFAAILPEGSVTPEEYLRGLDGETLTDALSGSCDIADTMIPKFTIETDTDLVSALETLGIDRLFDTELADLSALGISENGNLAVSRVLHRAVIDVDARGTKAGAATVVEIEDRGLFESTLTVHLTRPFIFFITDSATHTPIFCGIVNSVSD